jgi:D-glycero-alpha-D-manno-heptose-7-phosphate kinase
MTSSSGSDAPRTVTATACCRVDLAGGTLDIWPLGLLHPGSRTINLAVDLEVEVGLGRRAQGYAVHQGDSGVEVESVEQLLERPETSLIGVLAEALELPPVTVRLASDSPRGGGLGASSAMAVAFLAAAHELLGIPKDAPERSPSFRAHLARDLEARLMGLPTGAQDHYPALLGGALEIVHTPGAERVRGLDVDLEALGECLLLFFTGVSHFSAGQNWEVVRRRLEDDPEVRGLFTGISRVAQELPEALETGDLPRAGELVGREWSYRRHLADGVTTPEIDSLLDTARSLGAWGGKACGAGGGGCVLVLGPPERREVLAEHLVRTGVERLRARPSGRGVRVALPSES